MDYLTDKEANNILKDLIETIKSIKEKQNNGK